MASGNQALSNLHHDALYPVSGYGFLLILPDTPKVIPLTCHGHSRPITHLNFSSVVENDQYYLISASKDNNPMLRDGITGDWIGTFIGHKGACWSAVLSSDATLAATGSADFSAKIWDPQTGECLHTLSHNHIVRSVAFPLQFSPACVATGGREKKLRIFDLTRGSASPSPTSPNASAGGGPGSSIEGHELAPGTHSDTIKSVLWNVDYNIITTADDKTLRWFDLRLQKPIFSFNTDDEILSCELNTLQRSGNGDSGIITVAAGKSCYFFNGAKPGELLKKMDFDQDIASVAINPRTRRVVTGGKNETWAHVWDLETEEELEVQKGHHGPIWSVQFSPDGNLYATGSEDGTIKLWKACKEQYGLWR